MGVPLNECLGYMWLRSMGGSIADQPRLFKHAYDHLALGGWIEVIGFEAWASTDDDSLQNSSSSAELWGRLDEESTKFRPRMNIILYYKQALIDARFRDMADEIRMLSKVTRILIEEVTS